MKSRSRITVALVGLIVVVAAAFLVRTVGGQHSSGAAQSVPGAQASGLTVQALSTLPPEAKQTYQLIQHNGPFSNRQDGVVFDNREHRLPAESSGYYHEYTVRTPGASDRGARRLITGNAHEVYYTGNHYSSFSVVDTSH